MASDTADRTETNQSQPDVGVPRYRLVHKTSGDSRFSPQPLAAGITYVGRVGDNDVVLESELVSRRHAKIILTDMGVTVHDLDSHNGVFLNGKKVRSTPLAPGDLVYFGDVCCALEEDDGAALPMGALYEADINRSNLVSDASSLSETDDPAVRSLATLIQATDLLLGAADDAFFGDVLELCRALVHASLAVLVKENGDELESAVVLREARDADGDPPVRWPLVRKAVDDRIVFFSHEDGSALLAHDAAERAAVMCVPAVARGQVYGALYFSRPDGSRGYTERDVETLSAVAHIVGVRMGGRARPEVASDQDTSISSVQVSLSDTSEEASRAEIDRLQGELADLAKQLDGASHTSAQLGEERDALREALDEARAAIDRLDEERAALEANVRSSAAGSDARLAEAQAELKTTLAAHAEALKEISSERDAANARAAELDDRLGAKEAELDGNRAAHGELEQELERRAQQLEEAQLELARTTQDATAARQEAEALNLQLVAAKNEMQRLQGELARHDEADAADQQRNEALRLAVVSALPEAVSTRVLALAGGDEDTPLLIGDRTAVSIGLSGFDAWAASAAPTEVQERLDFFCARTRKIIVEHGGAFEQVLGHTHLALFDADQEGVLAAVRCACALIGKLRAESGVQVGVHTGSLVLGFFGDGSASVRAAAGEAIAVARGAQDAGQAGAVMVSESVRSKIPPDSGMMLVNCGPHIIRGMPQPVSLFQLMAEAT